MVIFAARKTLTVSEAEGRLGQLLIEAVRGEVIVLTDGDIQVTLMPRGAREPLDPEEDSPELEAELIRAIDGPYRPYSDAEFRAIGERIIRQQHQP